MSERKINPSPKEMVEMMNERGLKVYDGIIVTCAKTGEMWSVETIGDPDDAHAEIGPDGRVVFVLHDQDVIVGSELVILH